MTSNVSAIGGLIEYLLQLLVPPGDGVRSAFHLPPRRPAQRPPPVGVLDQAGDGSGQAVHDLRVDRADRTVELATAACDDARDPRIALLVVGNGGGSRHHDARFAVLYELRVGVDVRRNDGQFVAHRVQDDAPWWDLVRGKQEDVRRLELLLELLPGKHLFQDAQPRQATVLALQLRRDGGPHYHLQLRMPRLEAGERLQRLLTALLIEVVQVGAGQAAADRSPRSVGRADEQQPHAVFPVDLREPLGVHGYRHELDLVREAAAIQVGEDGPPGSFTPGDDPPAVRRGEEPLNGPL